ncbi:MAG: oligosaccharide repeat unit polymerase [Nitrospirae bacterium]|nr:oligosaccharide repeat unit polymerase [Nitrospirota bacterium]
MVILSFLGLYFGLGYLTENLILIGITQGLFIITVFMIFFMKAVVNKNKTNIAYLIASPLNKLFLTLLFIILLSFLWGLYKENDIKYVFGDLFKYSLAISIFFMTLLVIQDEKQIYSLMMGLFVLFAIIGIVDIMSFIFRILQGELELLQSGVRGWSQNLSIFGILLSISVYKTLRKKVLVYILLIIYSLSFLLALFRTGYFALFIGLLIIFSLTMYKKQIQLKAVLRGITISLVVFFVVDTFSEKLDVHLFESVYERVSSISEFASTTGAEIRLLEMQIINSEVLSKSPILGNGLGGTIYSLIGHEGALTTVKEFSPFWGEKHYIHNNIYSMLLRIGFVGTFLFIVIFLLTLKQLLRIYFRTNHYFAQKLSLGLIGIFIASIILSVNAEILISPVIMMMIALVYRLKSIESVRTSAVGLQKV